MLKKYISFAMIAAFLVTACSEEEFGPIVTPTSPAAFTTPNTGASYELTEDALANNFAAFSWTAADFGFDAAVTYTLEMDIAGNNFSNPIILGIVNALNLEVENSKINNALLTKEQSGDVSVEFRIAASVNENVETLYSDVLTLNVIPFIIEVALPQLQVPGSYQGWDPTNEETVIFDRRNNGKYEGFIYFSEDNTEFKYTDGPGWDVNYGDDGGDGTLEAAGANLLAPTAGIYKLNVDLNALTHTYERTTWGLIGSATPNGWDGDQDMTTDPETGNLSITVDLIVGEIKFRANDDWAINFGDTEADSSLEYDGDNIAIAEEGSYTIELLIVGQAEYTYKITKK